MMSMKEFTVLNTPENSAFSDIKVSVWIDKPRGAISILFHFTKNTILPIYLSLSILL